jgi:DNA-binding transcriptional ArsR family regulator
MEAATPPDVKRLLRAVAHPLRRRMLQRLAADESSASRLARDLGLSASLANYHVGVLRDLGCVTCVRTARRRGVLEHYYRATASPLLDDPTWNRLPVAARRALTAGVLHDIAGDISGAVSRGAFDPPGAHAVQIALSLDRQGWRELAHLVDRFIVDVSRVQRDSSERAAAGGEEDRSSLLTLLHFLRAPVSGP